MSRNTFSRRSLLAGLGGVALTLPMLQIFREREAQAATAPLRYLVMFAGMSGGRDESGGNALLPTSLGAGYGLSPSLQPLMTRGVRDNVSIVSNLRMARGPAPGQLSAEAGAAGYDWHTSSAGGLLSGTKKAADDGSPFPTDSSSDQIVANAFDKMTPLRALHYRVQASGFRGGEYRGQMSYNNVNGQIQANTPLVNAQLAYQTLASSVKPTDPAALAQAQKTLELKKSALVSVKSKANLLSRLGQNDRLRLQRHFDELSTFEASLGASGECKLSGAPTDSTAIVDNYSGEKERAPLLADLIRMSFACDLTRVATLMVTYPQSFLGTRTICPSGLASDCHETSHVAGTLADFQAVIGWHVDVFADLVAKFKATPDVDGKTLLDNTAIVYVFEGGYGFDKQTNGTGSHSSDAMCVLTAGRAAGNNPGKHIDGGGKHPASCVLTAMKNAGVAKNNLGDITTTIPELLL